MRLIFFFFQFCEHSQIKTKNSFLIGEKCFFLLFLWGNLFDGINIGRVIFVSFMIHHMKLNLLFLIIPRLFFMLVMLQLPF